MLTHADEATERECELFCVKLVIILLTTAGHCWTLPQRKKGERVPYSSGRLYNVYCQDSVANTLDLVNLHFPQCHIIQ